MLTLQKRTSYNIVTNGCVRNQVLLSSRTAIIASKIGGSASMDSLDLQKNVICFKLQTNIFPHIVWTRLDL